MALAAPTFDFPDVSGLVQESQARASSLMNQAWANLSAMNQSRNAEEAATAQKAARQLHGVDPSNPRSGYASNMEMWNQAASPAGQAAPGFSVSANGSDRDILARTLQAEAGGEGIDGMIAAGSVINNRVRTGNYGEGLRGVIMRPGQFSAWNGVTGYAGGEGAIDMDALRVTENAYRAADMLISGQYQDRTGGATHYYNPSVATPKWGQQAGGNWTRIGNHIFGFADAGRVQSQQPPQRQMPVNPSVAQNIMAFGGQTYNLGQPA